MPLIANDFGFSVGAMTVWSSWRSHMLKQGREVGEKFHSWPIPEQDIELDGHIAEQVIDSFLVWARKEHGLQLTPDAADECKRHSKDYTIVLGNGARICSYCGRPRR